MTHSEKDNGMSYCGYRCDLCPAFKDNLREPDARRRTSDGWHKFYGFRIPPEQIYCDGCRAPDGEQPQRIDTECPIRPCVTAKGLSNCACCDEYICDKLRQRLVDIAEIAAKQKGPIRPDEFDRFLKPYDNKTRLARLREQRGNR